MTRAALILALVALAGCGAVTPEQGGALAGVAVEAALILWGRP